MLQRIVLSVWVQKGSFWDTKTSGTSYTSDWAITTTITYLCTKCSVGAQIYNKQLMTNGTRSVVICPEKDFKQTLSRNVYLFVKLLFPGFKINVHAQFHCSKYVINARNATLKCQLCCIYTWLLIIINSSILENSLTVVKEQ